MAASASDYFQKVGRSTATTLSAPGYTAGSASINVGSTSNWPTDTGVTFAIDEVEIVDGEEQRIEGTYNIFRGTVASGTSINNMTYVGGDANRNYSAGATTRVYILVSYHRENRLVDGLLVSHDQDGTLKAGAVDNAAVLASDVVTTPKILDDAVTAPKVSGLDKSNLTTDSNPYKFSAYRNAAQNTGNNAYALLACDTELFDTNSNHSGGVYTAPVTGFYWFVAESHIATGAENRTVAIALFKNGSQFTTGNELFGTTGTNTGVTVSGLISLTAGDTVDARIFCTATKPIVAGVATINYFMGYLISRT